MLRQPFAALDQWMFDGSTDRWALDGCGPLRWATISMVDRLFGNQSPVAITHGHSTIGAGSPNAE
jgi:hypothetical protein